MSSLISQNPASLKMLFTEDIYLIQNEKHAPVIPAAVIPVEAPAKPESDLQASSFEYLGDNNKYFLILHDDKIHTRMNPVHQEMLLKVMAAKKLELRDLAIVNISRYPDVKFDSLKNFFSCTRVVLFGVQTSDIGLAALKLNKEQSAGNVRVLATYSLEDMRNSADKKREFWNVMKSF
ncbi:hypothetical protein GZH53_17145 [Flavihumibacter sp. R14]|nr:hypothetical protein [Flavihumibacter soli]